jgi:glycosyltransferase involved in cell wall biosynthesis
LVTSTINLSETASSPGRGERGQWLNVVSHIDPKYGGMSTVVPELSSATAVAGSRTIGLTAFCSQDEYCFPEHAESIEVSHWPRSRVEWLRNRSLRERFRRHVDSADGIHIHGLWEQSTAVAARTARELGKPYIVSAHGMLEPWALANKKLKKQVYAAFLERANIEGAACVHALTRAEAKNFRDFGSRRPIAIIPNGVRIPHSVSPDLFFERFAGLKGKRILLYLGRIHFKKGLDLLVEAWSRLAGDWPDAHLVLAGPDFEHTRSIIERLICDRRLEHRVLLPGMLSGDLKWSALAAAHCFILPSHSEGLSISTLEAMGLGLPIIVTRQCNLPEVVKYGAGWQIEPDIDPLVCALSECLGNSEMTNREIGSRGRDLVAKQYSWPTVGKQMSELYTYVQGGRLPQSFELQTD